MFLTYSLFVWISDPTRFLKPPPENAEKLLVKYNELRTKLTSFQEQSKHIPYMSPSPLAHPTEATSIAIDTPVFRKSITGSPDNIRSQRCVSPVEADRVVFINVKATSKEGSFEQFSSEDESNQHASQGCSLVPTSTLPSTLSPVPVIAESNPRIETYPSEHTSDGAQSRVARNDASLSARSSFRIFSPEEEERVIELDSEERNLEPELPAPKLDESPTLSRISAHGSFQAFSDEEMEEMWPVFNNQNHSRNQLPDNSTCNPARPFETSAGWRSRPPVSGNPKSAWPDASSTSAITRPESTSSVSAGIRPCTESDLQVATRGRWASSDIPTTTKLKHDAFLEKTRRIKFDAPRPFSPRHRPFVPRTSTSVASQGTSFPSFEFSTTAPQQSTQHTGLPRITGLGPSRDIARGSHHDEMIEVDPVVVSHSSPIMPRQYASTTPRPVRPGFQGTSPPCMDHEDLHTTPRLRPAGGFSTHVSLSFDA
jgi:hypothetical protein